jgi:hypothetical protein
VMIVSVVSLALLLLPSAYGDVTPSAIPSMRPPSSMRTYVSPVIDTLLDKLSPLLLDQDVAV